MAEKTIALDKRILDKNERYANALRQRFAEHQVYVIDLLSSPGSGKTSTIMATIAGLKGKYNVAVIEGDIASDVDAQTIKATGSPAVQINTGGLCHLEGNMITNAVDILDLDAIGLLIIENVGNLVCPVDFDLGENKKIMILSVPEGDDKPLKYPGIFQASQGIIVNKCDTMPVFDFDEALFQKSIDNLNPRAKVFHISATKGDGVDEWCAWLTDEIENAKRQ